MSRFQARIFRKGLSKSGFPAILMPKPEIAMLSRFRSQIFRAAIPAALVFVFGSPSANAEFAFEKKDRVAVMGNALPDRMQRHGWMETLFQSELPEKELVFRSLAFPGDQVDKRPRTKGYPSVDEYLKHVEADVIFAFFGYNESFAGEEGIDSFKRALSQMIADYRELKPNGESAPRIVLFSPIAHEDLESPNLPDGRSNNARLARYTEAMHEVADERGAYFVDLFRASQSLYAEAEEPLTINGVHPNRKGNRRLAEVIAEALLDEQVNASSKLEELRQAVVDKNWHWLNRYRATDGNDVWGGRSKLKFTDGQTNREVLQHELEMIDVMTANRDKKIWAIAQGGDLKVDDSNVPEPIHVPTNIGGKSPSSSARKEGNVNYLGGKEAISKMTVPDGFEVNLFAGEERFPELVNPVQMSVGPQGRLWVAAWKTYPKWEPLKKMGDRLLILPDEDRDGVADKAITFAKVHNPTGFEFWNGGVLVASAPDLFFLKDTDGDDKADVRKVYLQGLGSADTHHSANNFVYGPDGALYWQSGVFHQNNFEHPYGPSLSTGASGMFRFNPRTFTIKFHASNSPNPHGISFDRWGYHYANDGTSGRAYQVVPSERGFKMQKLLEKEVRPVAANGVVSSANFPKRMQGNFLICNTIGFLGLKQYRLERDPETGDVWGEPVEDLLVSEDGNFRPTDVQFGEDGALYVSDWQNVIIGHMQHNIRDPNRDHEHGRIYRMTYKGRPLQKPVPIANASLEQLMENLEHPVNGVRYRTRIELSGRDTENVMAACQEWMQQFDRDSKEDAHHLLEALWLHQQHNRRNPKLLADLLESPQPHARHAARVVQHHWYNVDYTHGSGSTAQVAEGTDKSESRPQKQEQSGVVAKSSSLTEVRISTVVEKMRYDVTEFTVRAGNDVRLTFANPDYMPHNLVVTEPKSADKVAKAALALGSKGFEKDYVPESDKIIAASELVDHGEEEVLEFTAPKKPGDYQYVCTFPGHHVLMRGIMKVRK